MVAHKSRYLRATTPSARAKVAPRLFLYRAVTPPLQGGEYASTEKLRRFVHTLILFSLLAGTPVQSQSIREHTRKADTDSVRARYRLDGNRAGTEVSDTQATDLTLTLNQVSVRPIQVWVRTAGRIDKTGKILTAYLSPADAAFVKPGQRVRAFPPESKSSMFQAWVTKVLPQGNRVMVLATLTNTGRENSTNYVMEIVTERGEFLSIPNEAIIEEGDRRVVYVQQEPGHYLPRQVQTGIQGELYIVVEGGLKEGEQVVSFGSFFIDSEYKLKSSDQGPPGNDQQHR